VLETSTEILATSTSGSHPTSRAAVRRVRWLWRWWPYALLQPVLTIALFVPNQIPFLDAVTAGAFVLFARAHPGRRAWGWWLLVALSIAALSRTTALEAAIRAAGFSGILILGFLASRPEAEQDTRHRAQEATALCLSIPLMGGALIAFRDLHPLTYDPVLARIDSWGPPVAWDLARWFQSSSLFRFICQATYAGLPLALVAVSEAERRQTSRRRSVLAVSALAALLGILAYQIVPATGPKYAFAGYPAEGPLFGEWATRAPFQHLPPRNAMPSLHMTWALLVAWHAARVGWAGTLVGLSFLGLTVFAVLATGEHYLVDLVIAVPFATAIETGAAGRARLAVLCYVITVISLASIALLGR
jgi:PAP2 superfamily protein